MAAFCNDYIHFTISSAIELGRVPTIRMCKFASLIFCRFKGFLTTRTIGMLGKKRAENAETSDAKECVRLWEYALVEYIHANELLCY